MPVPIPKSPFLLDVGFLHGFFGNDPADWQWQAIRRHT